MHFQYEYFLYLPDICEDLELKQRIMELKDEIESNKATRVTDLRHRQSRNSSTRRYWNKLNLASRELCFSLFWYGHSALMYYNSFVGTAFDPAIDTDGLRLCIMKF